MAFQFLDQKIRAAFSNAAIQYDMLTSLHKEIGRELAKKVIDTDHADNILDVGMGTGWLTKKISFYFPESTVVGLDLAEGMLNQAKKKDTDLKLVQAHASRLPFVDQKFDIITSNLAFQWVENLKEAFQECHRCLNDDRKLMITMFGYKTFQELFECLEYASEKRIVPSKRLPGIEAVQQALEGIGFNDIKISDERIVVHFEHMMDLLKWIKNIGANHLGVNAYLGKDVLAKAGDYYSVHHKDRLGIRATFEVLWVDAQK